MTSPAVVYALSKQLRFPYNQGAVAVRAYADVHNALVLEIDLRPLYGYYYLALALAHIKLPQQYGLPVT